MAWPAEGSPREDEWLLDAALLLRGSWENLPRPAPVPKTGPLPEPLVPLDQLAEWVWPGQGGGQLSWQEKTRVARHKPITGLIEMLVFI